MMMYVQENEQNAYRGGEDARRGRGGLSGQMSGSALRQISIGDSGRREDP